jgi:hypothetical protein
MACITVDDSRWPIARVKLPAVASDDEVRQYLDQLRVLRDRRERYALIIDANDSRGFSPKQRQMQASYIASGLPLSAQYLRAFAFVASSAMQRGMLTAIFWLNPPRWPYRIFAHIEQAEVWARQQIGPAAPMANKLGARTSSGS